MSSSDTPDQPVPQADTAAALMKRLAEQLGGRGSATAVFGTPVTSGGTTVIPVAEIAFGFAGGTGPEAGAAHTGGGGIGARPRGYIEIKGGTAAYKPL
ncbi:MULTISPECIES: GerW family sporulation protein [Streptomyces]|uniref:GerW family sporulation protein n=1 Tax=Streptomyces TaxID=1883 RepID=UPI001CCDFDFE|nr:MULTISPECIES: sporulation protein [Streptomyces]UBI39129.1 sporulation protein [Streptomyces mobaraensis]UKW31709.1 sporulation protein [Streptomyces sp. TYQ1024]